MKTYKFILVLFIAATVFVACDDALDLEPRGNTTSGEIQSFEDFEGRWAKLYAGLIVGGQEREDNNADIQGINGGFSTYMRLYWKLQELTTDEAIIAWNDGTIKDLHWQNWTADSEFIGAMYARLSYQIALCNDFLRNASESGIAGAGLSSSEADMVRSYAADARFLRALSYYHGIDLFGSMPFATEETAADGSALLPLITREDLFTFIESELLDVIDDLQSGQGTEYGRVNEATAQMLLAKLYLNAEVYTGTPRYTDALTYVQQVIGNGYTIDTSIPYSYGFLADNNSNGAQSEFIWTLNFDGNSTQTVGVATFLNHAPVGGKMVPANYGLDFGWAGLRTTPEFVELFEGEENSADQRENFFTDGQSKSISDVGDFTEGFAIVKFQNIKSDGSPGANELFVDTDFPMFRLADAYLMYAEAVLRGGGGSMTQAVDYINTLQERAYGNSSNNISTADLTLDFVLEERARELYWEAHRRQDLIRFNQFSTNGIWEWKGNVQSGVTTPAFRNLFPVPTTELNLNSNLIQNPGY
ncbi:RagB/SusD family nutrient uptake outer membrane protein [Nonlabens agnitus]|uniref:RagB/SusD family nutrient uptake outer membrane protein n=1 Tax=Nonlabens agnitus TaxID=870484 RepID=A0A2S9WV77_9FLAO|nr:RagB/SusD family nutrient uptake outer membrane protein [Nonlabens agnitus]PRP67390.1 RagB/SusD family nutrient uptake outer membrane protein [Nonlabens agnitus]